MVLKFGYVEEKRKENLYYIFRERRVDVLGLVKRAYKAISMIEFGQIS